MQQTDMPLKRTYAFWLSAVADSQGDKQLSNYQDQVKRIGSFSKAQEFWSFYQYMVRPDKLPEGAQFLLFIDGITPEWEDSKNKNGGRFILRVKREWGNRIWEELMLAFIGDETKATKSLCGLIMHAKKHFILISLWIKDVDQDEHDTIQEWIVKSLGLNRSSVEFLLHPREGEHQK